MDEEYRTPVQEMPDWDMRQWDLFLQAIENGLGWAASESMEHWFIGTDDGVAVVRELIAHYRGSGQS